ncbi:MAG TPA: zinc-binding alcohol dehydrogenase [Anaerolineales bacterium]|nr:zinc-binding alcohol dehydrogenase [Anaerolineales bacterium]
MKRMTLYFTAPRRVEFREETLPALGAEDVLVETTCSAISAGTEMLIYQGRFPQDIETDSVISSLRGEFKYPLAYGYACVGVVRETGKQVDAFWRNKTVFAFQPHGSHFISKPESLFPIPASLHHESACFLPNMETAVNLVQDAAPILGERVLVLGQGVVGLLTASLLAEFPLDLLVTADCHELRRKASLDLNVVHSLDPNAETFQREALELYRTPHPKNQFAYMQRKFDLTFELSGNPAALNDAIALTCFGGRVVIGSWYGEKSAEIDLGGTFHRSRIKIISSQVSTIAPELSGRWDKVRRFEEAWKALERIRPEKWITHRFSFRDAEKAYRLLDENPQETIQILFTYS